MTESFSQFEALILGAIQGVTEFLPISSSAHLILYGQLTTGKPLPLSHNIALHLGTALALLLYFSQDWFKLAKSLFKRKKEDKKNRELLFKLIVASIPAGLLGLTFKSFIETHLHASTVLILPLGFFGVALWLIDKKMPQSKNSSDLSYKDTFLIGLGQSLALIPGTSRSCATILSGRLLGLKRGEAIRFSFLMGTPIMLAAAVLHAKDFTYSVMDPSFLTSFASSFFVGIVSIHFFLRLFTRYGFFVFALYRIFLATLIYWYFS